MGLVQVNNPNNDFPNFTAQENLGKRLFRDPPNMNGAGCAGCHRGNEFDIDPNSGNNGIIGVAGSTTEIDLTNLRAPTLRDLVNPDGNLNGPLMHDGSIKTLLDVINHYDAIPNNTANTNLDNRLRPRGTPQMLNLTNDEKEAVVAFLKTLTGTDVYTNEKWSNPFDENGSIVLTGSVLSTNEEVFGKKVNIYPNPVENRLFIEIAKGSYVSTVYDVQGKKVYTKNILDTSELDFSALNKGIYMLKITDIITHKSFVKRLIKK